MKIRYNKSEKSVTLHIDTQAQALQLAHDLIGAARHGAAFPGTTIVVIEKGPKVERTQQYADVSVRAGIRRK